MKHVREDLITVQYFHCCVNTNVHILSRLSVNKYEFYLLSQVSSKFSDLVLSKVTPPLAEKLCTANPSPEEILVKFYLKTYKKGPKNEDLANFLVKIGIPP